MTVWRMQGVGRAKEEKVKNVGKGIAAFFVFVFVFVLVFVFVFEEDDEEKVRKTLARDWQCFLRSR